MRDLYDYDPSTDPELFDVLGEGEQACKEGRHRWQNPYPRPRYFESEPAWRHQAWDRGWWFMAGHMAAKRIAAAGQPAQGGGA